MSKMYTFRVIDLMSEQRLIQICARTVNDVKRNLIKNPKCNEELVLYWKSGDDYESYLGDNDVLKVDDDLNSTSKIYCVLFRINHDVEGETRLNTPRSFWGKVTVIDLPRIRM